MAAPEFTNYAEFWPFYLKAHAHRSTKAFHAAGLLSAITFAIFATRSGNYGWLPLCLVLGYGPAWYSHFFIEHNKPATFGHPFWSLLSDFRMTGLFLTGRL